MVKLKKMNHDLDEILNCSDLDCIAGNLSEAEILEHFGEDSFEYLTYQHLQAERMELQRLQIPRRTEDPSVTYQMLKSWIKEFSERNNKPLPKGFHQKNKCQLIGMYHGMLEHYGIKIEDIVPTIEYRY